MEDYRLTQSGQEVQDILDGAAMQSDLTAETERAELAEQTLQGNIDSEALARQQQDGTLDGKIDANTARIVSIEGKIPSGASTENKLATELYVNSSVATNTATFRGTYNLVSDLHLSIDATNEQIAYMLAATIATADNNDYCFVQFPTSAETPTEIRKIARFKYNGEAWGFEYDLNNSGFTSDQWAAINSGITSGNVAKLAALPTSVELTALLNGKQNTLTFDTAPTPGSTNPVTSGGIHTAIDNEKGARQNADGALQQAIDGILALIPSAATALNQLADKLFVNSSIATNTATFRGTFNLVSDLHLAIDATHDQIATVLAVSIATADNNDYCYVQIPTSATTPTEIAKTERYKFNGTAWGFEYDLNNSGFTSDQWAAINSGITAALVTKLGDLPTATEIANQFTAITNLIPSEATALNQLADKAYVLAQILAATPAFKGQFTTLADLQDVASPKAGDLGIVRTKDSDGYDVFTFYQYLNNAWNVFYILSHHPQTKPATTGTTGDYPYNGMGRVVISKNIVNDVNTLTQDAFEDGEGNPLTNTVFVIQYDFVLGENIEIPANCVLEFDGGSIIGALNCTLTLNDCYLEGLPKFDTVVFSGNIKNDMFDATWIVNGSDIGAKVNYAQTYFNRLYAPKGSYAFSTPMVINSPIKLRLEGDYEFTGTPVNNGAAISVIGTHSGNLYIHRLTISSSLIDYSNSRTVNFIGLTFINCKSCTIKFSQISYFNENIRMQGIGSGCAANKIYGGLLQQSNMNLRFYQRNSGSSIGWCNETAVYINWIAILSASLAQGAAQYAIFIGGPNADLPSFADSSFADSTDKSSNILLEHIDFENFACPIFERNVKSLSVINCREENCQMLMESSGTDPENLANFKYVPGYENKLNASALNWASRFGIPMDYHISIPKIADYPYKGVWCYDNSVNSFVTSGSTRMVGAIVDTSTNKLFRIDRKGISNGRMVVIYLNDAGNDRLSPQGNGPCSGAYWYSAFNAWIYVEDICIPANVNKAFIGVQYYYYDKDTVDIYSASPITAFVNDSPTKGTTAERKWLPSDVAYFDTDLGKPIWYNGTNWIDAVGNVV